MHTEHTLKSNKQLYFDQIWNSFIVSTFIPFVAQCSQPNLTDTRVIITPDQAEYDVGTMIFFSCPSGDPLQGSAEATCVADGTWDYISEPSCPG